MEKGKLCKFKGLKICTVCKFEEFKICTPTSYRTEYSSILKSQESRENCAKSKGLKFAQFGGNYANLKDLKFAHKICLRVCM